MVAAHFVDFRIELRAASETNGCLRGLLNPLRRSGGE
jgi:hypothetical protein